MSALVRADAAKKFCILQPADRFSDSAGGKACQPLQLFQRRGWIVLQVIQYFLVTFLATFLVTFSHALFHLDKCVAQCGEHKLDELSGVTCLVGNGYRLVLATLPVTDDFLNGDPCHLRSPSGEQGGLPISPHAPIAIGERMDELKTVMKHTTGHKGMGVTALHPCEKFADFAGNHLVRQTDMDEFLA